MCPLLSGMFQNEPFSNVHIAKHTTASKRTSSRNGPVAQITSPASKRSTQLNWAILADNNSSSGAPSNYVLGPVRGFA